MATYDVASNLDTYVEVAVPHYGSNAVVANFDLRRWGRLADLIGGSAEFRRVLSSFASVVELLPSYSDCCAFGREGGYDNRPVTNSDMFSFERWNRMLLDTDARPCVDRGCVLRRALLAASLESRKVIHHIMDQGVPPSVKRLVAFGGVDVDGTRIVHYFDEKKDHDPISFKLSGKGDGTVALVSAMAPEPDAHMIVVPRANHLDLLNHSSLQAQLEFVILNSDEKWTVEVSDQSLNFGRRIVQSTSVAVHPQIVLPEDTVRIDVSIRADSGVFVKRDVESETVSAHVIHADTGETAISIPLSLDARRLGSDVVVYTGTFHAPKSQNIYIVKGVSENNSDLRSIGSTLLSILTATD